MLCFVTTQLDLTIYNIYKLANYIAYWIRMCSVSSSSVNVHMIRQHMRDAPQTHASYFIVPLIETSYGYAIVYG